MNLFFGKISTKIEKEQINGGYYRAAKESSWFNGIQPGDYSYIIGGGKIQLWQAKEWSKKAGDDILQFEIIYDDLGINTKDLTAIKYFFLTIELVVLTVRSTAKSRKAFFPIKCISSFTETTLKDISIYKKDETYRKIHILGHKEKPDTNSLDIQLFKEGGEWKLFPSIFINKNIIETFKDNTPMIGSGQINKDKTISIIIAQHNAGKKIPVNDLSILQVYDLFCCDYKKERVTTEETPGQEDVIEENEFESAIREECNIILYGPPGTGKTYEVLSLIEDLDTNEKVGMQIEHKGTLNLNRTFWHLAPGRNGYLWNMKGVRSPISSCLGGLNIYAFMIYWNKLRKKLGNRYFLLKGLKKLRVF